MCKIGSLPLIYVQERTGGPELVGRNHEMAVSSENFQIAYLDYLNYCFKHQFRWKIDHQNLTTIELMRPTPCTRFYAR